MELPIFINDIRTLGCTDLRSQPFPPNEDQDVVEVTGTVR